MHLRAVPAGSESLTSKGPGGSTLPANLPSTHEGIATAATGMTAEIVWLYVTNK